MIRLFNKKFNAVAPSSAVPAVPIRNVTISVAEIIILAQIHNTALGRGFCYLSAFEVIGQKQKGMGCSDSLNIVQ